MAVAASASTTTKAILRCSGRCPTNWRYRPRHIVQRRHRQGLAAGRGSRGPQQATIETNLIAGMAQRSDTALEMFKKTGGGHLVLISRCSEHRRARR